MWLLRCEALVSSKGVMSTIDHSLKLEKEKHHRRTLFLHASCIPKGGVYTVVLHRVRDAMHCCQTIIEH